MKKTMCLVVAIASLVSTGTALASRVAGVPAPSPDSVRQAAAPGAAASHADDGSSMREGSISAISPKGDQVQINGSWLRVKSTHTHLFRGGRPMKQEDLAVGQKVRFTLAAGGEARRATLGAVYVP
jgi:hypothetical protein